MSPKRDRDQDRDREDEPEVHPLLGGQDRHRVGADRHEPGLAEVLDPGEADVELQPEREDRVDAGEDADAGPEVDVGERLERDPERDRERVDHTVLARPKMPSGRMIRTMIRMMKPTASLRPGSDEQGRPLDHDAEHDPGGERAEGVADPAEHDGGEDRQQQLEAELGLELGDRSGEDTGEPGEPGGEQPGVEDHARGVDAGRLGEVEVVRERAHPLAEQGQAQHQPGGDQGHEADDDHDQLRAADRAGRGS